VGYGIQRHLLQPLLDRPTSSQFLTTLGVLSILQYGAQVLWSPNFRLVKTSYTDAALNLGEVTLPVTRMIAFGCALLLAGAELLAAMELAQAQGAFGAAYLGALVSAPVPEPPPHAAWLELPDQVPSQREIDRELSAYEAYVWALDVQYELERDRELALNGEVRK
jgi:hypothetical protein